MPFTREDRRGLSGDLFRMRGLGIALVVFVHVLGVDDRHGVRKLFAPDIPGLSALYEFIHSFNMAVMVMGSGVALAVFGRHDRPFADFMRAKWQALVVPMAVWSPVLMGLQSLSVGMPRGGEAWRQWLLQLPLAWSPAQTIFWFVHVLVGCSLAGGGFLRFVAPRLGRWSGGVYLTASLGLHLVVGVWRELAPSALADYAALLSYWNRFFGLGLLVAPVLPAACRGLARLGLAAHALLSGGLLGLLGAIHAGLSRERYELVCSLNGPLGFCLLLSLAVLLRRLSRDERVAHLGAHSMPFYLFHLYFVSGVRIGLERWHPGTALATHLVLGCVMGTVGPWLLFRWLEPLALFRWSVGLPALGPTPVPRTSPPRADTAVLPGV